LNFLRRLKRGTTNKRERSDNDFKSDAVEEVKKLALSEEANVGNSNCPTLDATKQAFYGVVKRLGITKKAR
jgi:hypothetical protein